MQDTRRVIIIQLARRGKHSAGSSQRLILWIPTRGVGKANNWMGRRDADAVYREEAEITTEPPIVFDRGLASRANICAIIFRGRGGREGTERNALGPESGRMI